MSQQVELELKALVVGPRGIGVPEGGEPGQVVTRTEDGTQWADPPSGPGGAVQSVNGKTGAVSLGQADVGLGQVDNTPDLDKPVSAPTQEALDGKADKSALGTAATRPVEYFATAEQGAKADSAVQPPALAAYAKTEDVPTKTSQLTDDVGFLTQHQDISGKVDKEAGKGLSSNDFTTPEKDKLAGVAAGATANASDSRLRDRSTHTGTQALSTIGQSGATAGQVPKWDGTAWAPADESGGGSPNVISEGAPDDSDGRQDGTTYFWHQPELLTWYIKIAGSYIELGTKPIVPSEVIDPDAMLLSMNTTWANYWSEGPIFANLMYSASYPSAPASGGGSMLSYDRGSWVSSSADSVYSIALTSRAYRHPAGDYTILNPDNLPVQMTLAQTSPNPANWSTESEITWNFAGSSATSGSEFIRIFVKGSLTRVNGNLAVILPGHLDSWNAGNVWAKSYIDFHKALKIKTLRAMDLTSASDNYETNWSERSLPDRVNLESAWRNGLGVPAPYEFLCDLATRIGCNIWICLPHRATDDYIDNLADLLANHKPAGRKIYIEVGNEVWNSGSSYANGTDWFTYYDYTRRSFNYDPVTKVATLVGHGLSDGANLRCFLDLSAAQQQINFNGDAWRLRSGGGYVKKLTNDTFELYSDSGLTTQLPTPATTIPYDVIFVDKGEAGKSTRMNDAYGQRSKEIWDILDPVVGRENLVHIIAGQRAGPAGLAARLAHSGVKAATDYAAVAPYFNGQWIAGKLAVTSEQIEANWWSNYAHTVYVHAALHGTVVTQQDVIDSGTAYSYTTNGTSWRVAKTFTGLTNDSQYDVHFVFAFQGVDTHIVKTVTVSSGGSTEFVFDDPEKKALRDIADSYYKITPQTVACIAAADGVPLICYEGGLEDFSEAPADFETAVGGLIGQSTGDWIAQVYQESEEFAGAMVAHLKHTALAGAKDYNYYSSARTGCFSIASHFGDITDVRYLAFKALGGYINPMTALVSSQSIPADDITEAPGSFPATVYTFEDLAASYEIVGGNAAGRFAVSGNAMQYIDGEGVDYNDVVIQSVRIAIKKSGQVEFADVKFALGYSWFESDAFFAWDAFSDTDVSKLTPRLGKATDSNENTGLSSNTGGWRDFPATVKYSNDGGPKPAKIGIAKDIFVAITLKGLSGLNNYASILRQNEGANTSFYISKDGSNANLKLSIDVASKTIPLSTFSADPHVVWLVLRGGEYLTTGYDQTALSVVQTSAPLTGLVDSSTFLGTTNASRNGFQAGAVQVVVRDSISDVEAKAMVAKMQALHGIA